jgi:hypothetical protein
MWQDTITALMIMGLGVLPPKLRFDIVPLFGWRVKKCGVSNGELHMKAMEAAAVLLEQSTPLTPSNYARAHSTKLKLLGKHAPITLFK